MPISHLSSNRRERNSALIFQLRPKQENSPTTRILGTAKLFVTLDQKILKIGPKIGNPKIIRHFGPENPQNPTQKDINFEKMHSLTPAKMPTK